MKYTNFTKILFFIIVVLVYFSLLATFAKPLKADTPLNKRLKGRILIQPEANGEAWYVNPADLKRYFLNRPHDAFEIMREHGIGITNDDLKKIQIGLLEYVDSDNDGDGLSNRLETALKTDPENTDTDNDGYSDYEEITNSFNPLGENKLEYDEDFFLNNSGKIFLDIENNGEAWYLDPITKKRFYLGLPTDAFTAMKTFGLGITDNNISQIPIGTNSPAPPEPNPEPEPIPIPICTNCAATSPSGAMSSASKAFVALDSDKAKLYFTKDVQKAIEYTFEYQDDNSLRAIGGLLNDANLTESYDDLAIYKTSVYFDYTGHDAEIIFYVDKETDGKWRIRSL